MFAVLLFIITVLFGICIVVNTKINLKLIDQIASGIVVGIIAGGWLTLIVGFLTSLATGVLVYSIFAVLVIIVTAFNYKKNLKYYFAKISNNSSNKNHNIQLIQQLLVIAILFVGLTLTFSHFLKSTSEGWFSAGYTWADIALHNSLISYFANHVGNIDLNLPIFTGVKLTYPFLNDFYSSMLLKAGSNWQISLMLPTIALLFSFTRLLWHLAYIFSNSIRAAWFYLALVMFSGSTWGITIFIKNLYSDGLGKVLEIDYSKINEQGLQFTNLVTSHLLPQRSFLLGSCAVLIILIIMGSKLDKGYKLKSWLSVFLILLMASLPFVHVHSFFVACLLLFTMIVVNSLKNKRFEKTLAIILISSILLAMPQLIWQFTTNFGDDFSKWHFGWMTPPGQSVILFWLKNFGVMLILFAFAPWFIKKQKPNSLIWVLYISGLALFLAGNIYLFQPNDWDNMKFFSYSYIFMLAPAVVLLAKLSRHKLGGIVVAFVMIVSCFVGATVIAREYKRSHLIYSNNDLKFVHDAELVLPSDAVIVVNPLRHSNPLVTLGGVKTVLGYPGWVWTYGINYNQRLNDVNAILAGTDISKELITKYKVSHIAISDDELAQYGLSIQNIINNNQVVYNDNGWWLIAVN